MNKWNTLLAEKDQPCTKTKTANSKNKPYKFYIKLFKKLAKVLYKVIKSLLKRIWFFLKQLWHYRFIAKAKNTLHKGIIALKILIFQCIVNSKNKLLRVFLKRYDGIY